MFAPYAGNPTNLIPVPLCRPRLLLVTDSPERRRRLLGRIDLSRFEVTCADSLMQLRHRLRRPYDAVLMDVSSGQLLPMLNAVRNSEANFRTSLLVESSARDGDPSLAGVLPTYRAMPCTYDDMMRLVARPADPPSLTRLQRGVL
ncbi:MAG: hypothetical protein SF339_23405 [Blastocatellia bacterium]|nr:hypothetical protein [Blastocatellia bacterium]